jgi:hypothetical protein
MIIKILILSAALFYHAAIHPMEKSADNLTKRKLSQDTKPLKKIKLPQKKKRERVTLPECEDGVSGLDLLFDKCALRKKIRKKSKIKKETELDALVEKIVLLSSEIDPDLSAFCFLPETTTLELKELMQKAFQVKSDDGTTIFNALQELDPLQEGVFDWFVHITCWLKLL